MEILNTVPLVPRRVQFWIAGFLAIATGILFFYPTFAYWRLHSSKYFPISTFDEDYYAALASTLAAGHPLGAHPFLAGQDHAHGIGSETLLFLPRVVTAGLIKEFGLGRAFGIISLVAPILVFLLIYLALHEVAGDFWWSLAGASGILLLPYYLPGAKASIASILHIFDSQIAPGLQMPDGLRYARRYNPALTAVLFYLFLYLHWKVSQLTGKMMRGATIACGIVGGLLFYAYFYFAVAAFAISVLWTLLAGWTNLERFRPALFALFIQTVLAIPFFIVTRSNMGIYQSAFGNRVHTPYFPTTDVAAALLPVCVLLLRRGLTETYLWLSAIAVGPILAMNAQIVTGVSVEPWHFDDYLVLPISIFLLCVTCAILLRSRTRLSAAAGIVVTVIAFSIGGMTQARVIHGKSMISIPDPSEFNDEIVAPIRTLTHPGDVLLMGEGVTSASWLVATTTRPVFISFYVASFPANAAGEYQHRADCYYWLRGDDPDSFYSGPASDSRSYVYASEGFHYWFRPDLLTNQVKEERTANFRACAGNPSSCCPSEFRADWLIESVLHRFDRERLSQIFTVTPVDRVGEYEISKLDRLNPGRL